jgi:GntR family transcriptional repressor for pyruvate dehydrogenase complex
MHGMERARASIRDFAPIERRTVTRDAIDQVRTLIAEGALKPQQRLPAERALADQLRVSRPTLREALRALAAMGIVESRAGSGTYVTGLGPEVLTRPLGFMVAANAGSLRELFEIRLLLEVGAAEAAAREIDATGLARLDETLADLRGAVADPRRFLEADSAFHRIIHEASGNGLIVALGEALSLLTSESRLLTAMQKDLAREVGDEHEEIIRHLRAHDAAGAATAMRNHLRWPVAARTRRAHAPARASRARAPR